VAVSGSALAVLSPVLVGVAAVVKLSGPGPAIFRQQRVGQGGVPFTSWKFRTMVPGAGTGSDLTMAGDERVTRVGRLLRAWSLDELPQLVNVLRGDMTLVGPRPETLGLAARYRPDLAAILDYRPGLTGSVQVTMRDVDADTVPPGVDPEQHYLEALVPRRVALDLEYLADPTLGRTFGILVRTIVHVVRRGWSHHT
jgi:lipopolysaccharide/colanic/teichoic acid biosynthesis glycosyltransferase